LSRFNFGGSDQKNKSVATLLVENANGASCNDFKEREGSVLLLDEPTNDLDINARLWKKV
jgi:ATPase subunit of ABC transporter with duplicated ATPase domains